MLKNRLLFLPVLLWTSFLFGAQIPDNAKMEVLEDFSYGLVTSPSAQKVNPKGASKLRNFYIDEKPNSLVSFNGFTLQFSTPALSKVENMIVFYKEDGTKEYILSDSSQVFATNGTYWKTLRTQQNVNFNVNFLIVRKKVWGSNGSDAVWTYDGSSVTVLDGSVYGSTTTPNVPRFKYFTEHLQRVFGLNTSSDASQIRWSAITSTDGTPVNPDS